MRNMGADKEPTNGELAIQIQDIKERQIDFQTDVKGRLTSIDASLSALAPLISAHTERFNSMEGKCDARHKSQGDRISRLEKGGLSTLVVIAGMFLTGVWTHIFPPRG